MGKALKSIITHPESKREMKIDASIYEPFKAAILQSLKGSKGKTFSELVNAVEKIIHKKLPVPIASGIKKSIPWYTISIRLDLETKGLVQTFTLKGKNLCRLAD